MRMKLYLHCRLVRKLFRAKAGASSDFRAEQIAGLDWGGGLFHLHKYIRELLPILA